MIPQKSFFYDDLTLKKYFLLLSMLKTVVLLNIFGKNMIFDNYKEHFLFEIFCNIINVFTATLDQFNASPLNKSIIIYYV